MTYSYPIDYPPTMTADEAAKHAGEDAQFCRGARLAALTDALELYHAGRYVGALEVLVPMLRYNVNTAAARVTGRLYGRWVHTVLPETLEPFLGDWLQAMAMRHDADNARRAGYLIDAAIMTAEKLLAGQADDPISAWRRLADIVGATGCDVLPRPLWQRAVDLTLHIARTRLRAPNLAPSYCLGKRVQRTGHYNALGF